MLHILRHLVTLEGAYAFTGGQANLSCNDSGLIIIRFEGSTIMVAAWEMLFNRGLKVEPWLNYGLTKSLVGEVELGTIPSVVDYCLK